tara:strand:+ start:180 stop:605 length:426 start_codon:yes stop_codon:yes gene_type:complete
MNHNELEQKLSIEDILRILEIKRDKAQEKEDKADAICVDLTRFFGREHAATDAFEDACQELSRVTSKIDAACVNLEKLVYALHIVEESSSDRKRFWVYKTHADDMEDKTLHASYKADNPRTEPIEGPMTKCDATLYIQRHS